MEKHPEPRSATRTSSGAPSVCRLALLAVALLTAPACSSPETIERPLRITVETVPPGGTVRMLAYGAEPVDLGTAPVVLEGLTLVRTMWLSERMGYWLRDDAGALPPNTRRPKFASNDFKSGANYPLEVTFEASRGTRRATSTVVFDHDALVKYFDRPGLLVRLPLQ